MPERMKLLGSAKSTIAKNENGGNVPHLETTEVPTELLKGRVL